MMTNFLTVISRWFWIKEGSNVCFLIISNQFMNFREKKYGSGRRENCFFLKRHVVKILKGWLRNWGEKGITTIFWRILMRLFFYPQCPVLIIKPSKGYGKHIRCVHWIIILKVFNCKGLYCIIMVIEEETSAM